MANFEKKYYRTVLGDVPVDQIGHTQTHEHLLCDLSGTNVKQGSVLPDAEEIRLDNYYETRRHHSAFSIVMDSVGDAIQEISDYKHQGGDAVVDATSIGLKRNPKGLKTVSEETGVHVVMGCGYYYRDYHPAGLDEKTEEDIAHEIIQEVTHGVGDTLTKAGIIGEIGLSWPLHPIERTVLKGAVEAQRATGAALMIHPGRESSSPIEAIRLIEEYGGDSERVIMSHIDRTLFDVDSMLRLAETGCYLEFDLFGQESSYYPYGDIDMPNDAIRVNYLIELIARGHVDQLLVAQDICKKVFMRKYGGEGYGHILRNVIPLMRRKGMSEEHITGLTVDNPRRIIGMAS